ncbi:sigma-70 family RNA polymerase sigma factor [Arthrobacter sp. MPF02]|uniref:sigma-70 family RNA polymerase sigma factor n=1 Tax=Arthrobacter sp. MPF02 TaxID=3388492 RepID=UPI00398566BE
MGRIAGGDRRAFEDLYVRTVRRLFGLALSVSRRPELAEEIVQDVYVQVWSSAGAYDPARGSVLAWLFTLTHRRAVDVLRHERSCRERDARYHRETLALGSNGTEEAVLRKLDDEKVLACLAVLSAARSEAICLAYFGGQTYTEVTRTLNVSVPAVKSHIRDGLRVMHLVFGSAESYWEGPTSR